MTVSVLLPVVAGLQGILSGVSRRFTGRRISASSTGAVVSCIGVVPRVPSKIRRVVRNCRLFGFGARVARVPTGLRRREFAAVCYFYHNYATLGHIETLGSNGIASFICTFRKYSSLARVRTVSASSTRSIKRVFRGYDSLIQVGSPLSVDGIISRLSSAFIKYSSLRRLHFAKAVGISV